MALDGPTGEEFEDLLARAGRLTVADWRRLAAWVAEPRPRVDALWTDRQMAILSTFKEAETAGRRAQQLDAIDETYRAVARGAGFVSPISYFAESHGERPEWEAAAAVAAETAAALVVRDLLHRDMFELLVDPWVRLAGGEGTSPDADNAHRPNE